MSYKNFYETNNYVINSLIIEKVKNLNLSLNDFLLLIYFINKTDKKFVLDDITKSIRLNQSEILDSLNSLLEKNLIELKTNDVKGNIEEYISLDKMYQLFEESSSDDESTLNDVKKLLEEKLSMNVTATEIELIKAWIGRGFSLKDISRIVDKALYNKNTDIRYLDKLLYELSSNDDPNQDSSSSELFDYDWLDEEKK